MKNRKDFDSQSTAGTFYIREGAELDLVEVKKLLERTGKLEAPKRPEVSTGNAASVRSARVLLVHNTQ